MKRFILSLISSILIILMLFPIFSSAEAQLYGDIDKNGKVEASDARTVLRASVALEELSNNEAFIADCDNSPGITANDARIILRMSVSLEKLQEITSDDKDASEFEVHFIDVGQADCSLIICDGDTLLIDGGNISDGSLVTEYLFSRNIEELDYVICTHAHEDHVGGLSDVLNEFTVTKDIFAPATGSDSKCYLNFISSVNKQGKEITVPDAGYTFSVGSSTVEISGPVSENYSDINNTSVVSKITYGETSFLFTGDAEREAEEDILKAGFDISATVLKVGHHGSENSTTYPFLREVMPEYAIISVGTDNSYGHPTEAALSRLSQAGAEIYRTDIHGNIVITSDGKSLEIKTEKTDSEADNKEEATEKNEDTQPPDKLYYIGNINSKKLHLPTCSSLPSEKNRIYFASKQEALAQGYTLCSRCEP